MRPMVMTTQCAAAQQAGKIRTQVLWMKPASAEISDD